MALDITAGRTTTNRHEDQKILTLSSLDLRHISAQAVGKNYALTRWQPEGENIIQFISS